MDMKQIIKKTLYVVGTLFLMNIVLLLFVSNFHEGFVFLAVVSVAIILYAYYLDRIAKFMHIVIILVCLVPFATMVFLFLYGNYSTVQYDENVVIVLGAGLRGEDVTRTLANRLDRAIEYYKKNSNVIIVVCGGLGEQADITEALAMKRYLIDRGVPKDNIIKEDNSHNTLQNLYFANNILTERFPEGFRSVIVTNDFHVYRAMRFARIAGIPYPRHMGARTPWYTLSVNYLRETVAVFRMWVVP
jgi:uncharacterized SAM-binding protein YcdF (DUF218 family)